MLSGTYPASGGRSSPLVVTHQECVARKVIGQILKSYLGPRSGYSYDAAGNMTYDGNHSYTYDAEGNITAVDGGGKASYVYNALNQRVRTVTTCTVALIRSITPLAKSWPV
jgi:hypothetical protein